MRIPDNQKTAQPAPAGRNPDYLPAAIARRLIPVAVFTGLAFQGAAHAAMINVAHNNAASGDGCSLVQAIEAANTDAPVGLCSAGSGADTIELDPNRVFTFTSRVDSENALPVVTSDITINGRGSTLERDSAASDFRLLEVANSGSLTLNDLVVRGGVADEGSGIRNAGTLRLERSTVENCSASSSGGGIFHSSASGLLTLFDSTVTNNSAAAGGGIAVRASDAAIYNSTIHNNAGPGAIDLYSYSTLTISNSTISGNVGSGLSVRSGTASLSNSTITNNGANGIYADAGAAEARVRLDRTIVSGNTGNDVSASYEPYLAPGPNFFSGGDNLIGDGNAAGRFNEPGDQTLVTDPQLGPLFLSGGQTATHVPEADSPAIDAVVGDCIGFPDQRGAPVNQDGDKDGTAACDIGSVERAPDPIVVGGACSPIEAIENANDTSTGQPNADCAAGAPGGPDTIVLPDDQVFTFSVVNNTLNGANALPPITSAITIQGNGATLERGTAGGTADFRLLYVDSLGDLTLEAVTLRNGRASAGGTFGSQGGAAFVNNGQLTLTDSTVSGNSASNDGGAFYNRQGTLNIVRSTVSGNSAGDDGGAVLSRVGTYNQSTNIDTSTLSGNSAGDEGGAIRNVSGFVGVGASTLTDNTATMGAGLSSTGNAATTLSRVANSIVSGNIGPDVDVTNGSDSTITSGSYNIVGTGNAAGEFNRYGDQAGVTDPRLGTLADNGGRTLTHLPLIDSPAVDQISAITLDEQRGARRLVDANGNGAGASDIGAVELLPPIVVADNQTEFRLDGLCSLPEAIANANDESEGGGLLFPDCSAGFVNGADTITLPQGGRFIFSQPIGDSSTDNEALQEITSEIRIEGNGAVIERSNSTVEDFRLIDIQPGGDLAMDQVTLRGGKITNNPSFQSGGAIHVYGSLALFDSTITGNEAETGGGGIDGFSGASISLTNSTLSGNTAGRYGGAVYNRGGTLVLNSVTIANNSAPIGSAILQVLFRGSPDTTVSRSLFAGNTGGDACNVGVGTFNTSNSFSDDASCTGMNISANAAQIDPLRDNGGPTETHNLLPDNPAVDGIPATVLFNSRICLPSQDQRGTSRPLDGDLDGTADCDAGAVEFIDTITDSDDDGLPDSYETANGLDPNDDGSGNVNSGPAGDADGDGISNIDEFNDGLEAGDPDSDDDGLGDGLDAEPTTASNACIQDGNGDAQFDFTAMSGMTTQCAADNSITVLDAANAVIEPGAVLQLYSLSVSFGAGAAVPQGAEVQTIIGDPRPGMAP